MDQRTYSDSGSSSSSGNNLIPVYFVPAAVDKPNSSNHGIFTFFNHGTTTNTITTSAWIQMANTAISMTQEQVLDSANLADSVQ